MKELSINAFYALGTILIVVILISGLQLANKRFAPLGSFSQSFLRPILAKFFTSQLFVSCRRLLRQYDKSSQNILNIFISVDDPQSLVLLQCANYLLTVYNVIPHVWILRPKSFPWDSGPIDRQIRWIYHDSKLISCLYQFDFPQSPNFELQSSDMHTARAIRLIREHPRDIKSIFDLTMYLKSIWLCDESTRNSDPSGEIFNDDSDRLLFLNDDDEKYLNNSHKMLKNIGYYGSGILEFEGELFTSSRIHHLERCLRNKKLSTLGQLTDASIVKRSKKIDSKDMDKLYFDREVDFAESRRNLSAEFKGKLLKCIYEEFGLSRSEISNVSNISSEFTQIMRQNSNRVQLFYSFRSPYSQLILDRLHRYCVKYGVELEIRILMPMVMRGLSVPFEKAMFIAVDAAREARLWNINFGYICDPISNDGLPVKRALCGYIISRRYGKEYEYLRAFAENIWGNGYDAGTDYGMEKVSLDSGVPWVEVQRSFLDVNIEREWQEITQKNRDFLTSRGLWGVPCVEYDGVLFWGQDKLWILETILDNKVNCHDK